MCDWSVVGGLWFVVAYCQLNYNIRLSAISDNDSRAENTEALTHCLEMNSNL